MPPVDDSWRVYSKPGNLCVICAGKGFTKCLYCYGDGVVRIGPEPGRDTVTCPHCEGTRSEICVRCAGTGIRPSTRYDVEARAFVPNLTNEDVCRLPLDDVADVADVEAEKGSHRETASNGVPS